MTHLLEVIFSAYAKADNKDRRTHESESSNLCLLLTTEFEANAQKSKVRSLFRRRKDNTHCLQRFNASCILYLQTVHSSLSTTFFVVLACTFEGSSANHP